MRSSRRLLKRRTASALDAFGNSFVQSERPRAKPNSPGETRPCRAFARPIESASCRIVRKMGERQL